MSVDLHAPLAPWPLLAAAAIVALAGVVRGFAGFGFSALSVAGLSLLMSPARVVPPIFLLEVLASVGMLRSTARDIDWPWLGWLALGNALCIPLGIAALAWLPETPLRLLIGGLLLLAAVLLRSGVALRLTPSPGVRLSVGMVSGLVNGLSAIGGIAVAVLLSTTQIRAAALRATLVAMFLFTDLYALGVAGVVSWSGAGAVPLLDGRMLAFALWMTPPMSLGIWIGHRSFAGVSQALFRRRVLDLLIGVAGLAVLRALLSVLGED